MNLMFDLNSLSYKILDEIFALVAKLGLPLIIAAWLSVAIGSIGMGYVLRRHRMCGKWIASIAIGCLALVAHLLDYFTTLKVSPDLCLEANPIWCIVVERMGLEVAKWYGLTGKLMLSILSFELFAYYLIQREYLFPQRANDFVSFWRKFGSEKKVKQSIDLSNIINFFAFLFPLINPFCFYIAFLNNIADEYEYMRIPSMPIMLVLYILFLTFAYLFINYWAFRRQRRAVLLD